jgi:hypothetical protein
MNRRWLVAAIVAILLLVAFVYRPALFGFYGLTERQCVFLYAVDAPTKSQSMLAFQYCTGKM